MNSAARHIHVGDRRGVTLVELMFGLVISMIVVSAGYTVMTSTQKAATVNDQATQMQQNARVAMDLIAQDLKMAGFGMSSPVGGCNFAVVPSDNTPAGADTGPDSFSVVVPTTAPLWALQANLPGGPTATQITLSGGGGASMVAAGFGTAPFALPQPISIGGTASATVTAMATDTLTVSSAIPAPSLFVAGTQVSWLQCITYDIATTVAACGGAAPCLRRGGVPIAEGIEDLQLAFACDGCSAGGVPDGVIDDQNASNTFDAADFVSDSSWTTAPMTPDTFRMARISIVARQTRSDLDWSGTQVVVADPDHNPTADAGYNAGQYAQIRRRMVTRTIEFRNLGL
jgi:type IV pilus assembly protein PilW